MAKDKYTFDPDAIITDDSDVMEDLYTSKEIRAFKSLDFSDSVDSFDYKAFYKKMSKSYRKEPKFSAALSPEDKKEIEKSYDLLFRLYYAYSPSMQEFGVRAIVIQELNKMGIGYDIDEEGNVFSFKRGAGILSAHMDQVCFDQLKNIDIDIDHNVFGNTSLGADDKNGVYIVLKLLEAFPGMSFCFSVNEESGGGLWNISDSMPIDIPYCLVFDRRGNTDIIGKSNGYCSKRFENKISKLLKPLGYKPNSGTWSDANFFSQYTDSVNLSCGYYEAHSSYEYANLKDIEIAIQAGKVLIGKL